MLFHITQHIVFRITDFLTVFVCACQRIRQSHFRTRRIVLRVIGHFICDLLDLGVLCGIYFQTSAVNGIVGFCLIISKFIFQIMNHLKDQCIIEIRVGGIVFLLPCIDLLNSFINIIIHCFRIFTFCDIMFFQHDFQNRHPPGSIIVRMCDRVHSCWVLCDAGQDGAL